MQRTGQLADQGAEVDPMRCGEVDHHQLIEVDTGIHEVDRDDLHRQLVSLDQLLGGQLCLGASPAVGGIPLQLFRTG